MLGSIRVWARFQAIAALCGVRVDELMLLDAREVQRRIAARKGHV